MEYRNCNEALQFFTLIFIIIIKHCQYEAVGMGNLQTVNMQKCILQNAMQKTDAKNPENAEDELCEIGMSELRWTADTNCFSSIPTVEGVINQQTILFIESMVSVNRSGYGRPIPPSLKQTSSEQW